VSTVNYQALVRVCSLSVVALAVSLHSGGALSAEAVELKRKNRLLEEVVVTAQKREENAQDVPISVLALSGEMLEAMGVDDPTDLQAVTPGLTYGSATGFAIVYLRGVGSDAFLMADPSVATYIDGIYYPFASGLAQSFGKVERVEVLKGPQGTLFGRNTTGGAISITTETPDFDDMHGSVSYTYGHYEENGADFQKARANINVPFTNNLAASLAVFSDTAEQYMRFDEDSVQQHSPNEVAQGYRFKIKASFADKYDLMLAAVGVEQSGFNTALAPNTGPSDLAVLLGAQEQPRDYSVSVNAPINFDIDSEVYYAQFNAYFDALDIRLLLSDQYINNLGKTDFDGTNAPIAYFGAPVYSDVKTAELQLLSNEDSWGAGWLQWVAGLYYIDSVAGVSADLALLGGETGQAGLYGLSIPLADIVSLVPGLADILGPVPLAGGVSIHLEGELATESTAAFAQSTFTFNEWSEMSLGARYQEEHRHVVQSSFGLTNGDGSYTTAIDWANGGATPTTADSSNFSPKISFNFYPFDDAMIYVSAQKGYKSGTFNTFNINSDIDYAGPEDVTAYELGLKYTSSGGNVRVNTAVFETTVDDIQVQVVSLMAGGTVRLENAGSARIRGAEVDATIMVFPALVDDLILAFGGAYLDGIYTDYKDGTGFNESTGMYEEGQDFSGKPVVRTPEFSATAALSKLLNTEAGPLEMTVDGYYNSGYSYLAQGDPFKENEYYLVNARISYLIEDMNLRFTLSGKNLADTIHAYSQFPSDFGRLEALAPPKSYSIALSWEF
jgi:iron complex outermembrane receptor protein